MPYLYESHEGIEAMMRVNIGHAGPQFSPDQMSRAVKLNVWGSTFSDPGPDYCEFVLLDGDGEEIDTKRSGGY